MGNINLKTGIRYGYISASELDSDLVDTLIHENGVDVGYESFLKELESTLDLDTDEGQAEYDEALEAYEDDEPAIEGIYDGVHYATSWIGGALHFFIFESPVIAKCSLCSPCVPGAGDLGTQGEFECYGVPEDWKNRFNL